MWGLANDGKSIIVSDGTSSLSFLDPSTLQLQRQLTVTDAGGAGVNLNELEVVDGLILANIWRTDCIAQIDPGTGRVVGWALMQGLRAQAVAVAPAGSDPDVLNGIAWDAAGRRLFVTGKNWAQLYQVELVPASATAQDLAAARAACTPPPLPF